MENHNLKGFTNLDTSFRCNLVVHWWDEISSKSIEDNKNAALQALVGVYCTILRYEQIFISISKNKIDIFRFTLSRRRAWVQTDKVSSLKLRAGMGQSCWSIEQFMSQINSVCETCWELQRPSHRQLRGVFASNCGPRREKSNLDNKLLADSGEKCALLKEKLIKFKVWSNNRYVCFSLTEHEVHSSNGNMETFWIQNTFYCFELGRLAS